MVSHRGSPPEQEEQIIATGATLFYSDGSGIRISSKTLDLSLPHLDADTEFFLFIAAALWAITRDQNIFSELNKLARDH